MNPRISPDGRKLAFVRSGRLHVASLTAGLEVLSEPKPLDWSPPGIVCVWTADSSGLICSAPTGEVPQDRALFRVSPGRPSPERLPFGEQAVSLAVSRAGDRLAYWRLNRDNDIWRVANPEFNGGKSEASRHISSTRGDHAPEYSPDGRSIAFLSLRSGSPDLWIANSDGGSLRRLTALDQTSPPRWSRR